MSEITAMPKWGGRGLAAGCPERVEAVSGPGVAAASGTDLPRVGREDRITDRCASRMAAMPRCRRPVRPAPMPTERGEDTATS
jgi:hypothetical protein